MTSEGGTLISEGDTFLGHHYEFRDCIMTRVL